MDKLQSHARTLVNGPVTLRPMHEDDWELLLRWNNDPEVLYFSDGNDVEHYTLEEVQAIYRSISQNAFMFIIEFEGIPVGECWLQRMNLSRILEALPGEDLRRIDIAVGETNLWGRGIGTNAVRCLTVFGFEEENADAIFACDIAIYNTRSLRTFHKVGFTFYATVPERFGVEAMGHLDLIYTRERYHELQH